MASLKITERPLADTLRQGASILITQQEMLDDTPTESLRRLNASGYLAPPIVSTLQGNPIIIRDGADWPLQSLRLFGKTTQQKTSGKNLLNGLASASLWIGENNVYKADSKTAVKVIGTVTLRAGTPYTLSATRLLGTGSMPCLILRAPDGANYESNYGNTNLPVVYTPAEDVSASVLIQGDGGNTSVTVGNIFGVQLEIGSSATSFEPYSGGVASPSPAWPQPLANACKDGANLFFSGKNMLNLSDCIKTNESVSFDVTGDSIHISVASDKEYSGVKFPAMKLLAGVTYTLSATVEQSTGSPRIGWRSADGNAFFARKSGTGFLTLTYTPQEDVYAYANLMVSEAVALAGEATFSSVQLEIGSAATAFEPYKDGDSASFSTPNGLPGIPVSSGGNYADENGQQWLCDEIIWPEMTYVQRVVRLTGFTKQNSLEATDIYVAPADNALRGKSENIGLCNVTDSYGYNEFDNTHFYVSATTCVVYVPKGFSGSIEALVALAEPIETTLELVINQDLASQHPNTTILNDGGAGMEASYVADTKTYIDQRISALLSNN